jgi:hypothetical protein
MNGEDGVYLATPLNLKTVPGVATPRAVLAPSPLCYQEPCPSLPPAPTLVAPAVAAPAVAPPDDDGGGK